MCVIPYEGIVKIPKVSADYTTNAVFHRSSFAIQYLNDTIFATDMVAVVQWGLGNVCSSLATV